jgi:hypothetical protein
VLITATAGAQSAVSAVFRVPAGMPLDAAYAAATAVLAIRIHHAVGIGDGGSGVGVGFGEGAGAVVLVESRPGVTGAIEGR